MRDLSDCEARQVTGGLMADRTLGSVVVYGTYDDPWGTNWGGDYGAYDYGTYEPVADYGGGGGGGTYTNTTTDANQALLTQLTSLFGADVAQVVSHSPELMSILVNSHYTIAKTTGVTRTDVQHTTVYINPAAYPTAPQLVSALAHEAGHVLNHAGSPSSYATEEAFLNAALGSEGYATIISIDVMRQLKDADYTIPLTTSNTSLISQYEHIYDQSRLSDVNQCAHDIGVIYGNYESFDADGDPGTPGMETYYQLYTGIWDAAH
jgi:hypothetical protein